MPRWYAQAGAPEFAANEQNRLLDTLLEGVKIRKDLSLTLAALAAMTQAHCPAAETQSQRQDLGQ